MLKVPAIYWLCFTAREEKGFLFLNQKTNFFCIKKRKLRERKFNFLLVVGISSKSLCGTG